MARYQLDLEFLARIRNEQNTVKNQTLPLKASTEVCPYCKRRTGIVYKPGRTYGITAVIQTKCTKCAQEIYLPISFRSAAAIK